MRSAVCGDDGDEFGLFEGLENGFAVGLEGVGEEDFVVADLGGGGEGFDEFPGLGGGPGAPGGAVDVEDVHFEDFGGGLLDYFLDCFYG